jgi:4-alpha-glucanotransferase
MANGQAAPNPLHESRPRYAGILFHITSLPGPYGIGDLGSVASSFADFLASAGVSHWQILPLGPTGYGNSPYSARSCFAGNELLISPDRLAETGLVTRAELAKLAGTTNGANKVDFNLVEAQKLPLLKKAARRFTGMENKKGFDDFCRKESYWLEDYALFRVLYEIFSDARWHTVWDKAIANREEAALDKIRLEKAEEILEWKVLQYFFECQWQELKAYVNSKGIRIIGDIPIFAAPDSADTWSHIDLFKTGANGKYSFVSGVPPDFFCPTGQLWGNPVYDWKQMRADGYRWWTDRVRRLLSQVDMFRIDHFRGFDAYWAVPADHPTAEYGTWEQGPGADFFQALKTKLGELPVLAEDLGFMTESVLQLRDGQGFPGMKVCQFGFENITNGVLDARHLFLPHNYGYFCAAYTGTHDNSTTAEWYKSLGKKDRRIVAAYFNCPYSASPADIARAMIRAVAASHAEYAIFPLQDLLGLGNETRFNTPGTCNSENWSWRLGKLPPRKLARQFALILSLFGRHSG